MSKPDEVNNDVMVSVGGDLASPPQVESGDHVTTPMPTTCSHGKEFHAKLNALYVDVKASTGSSKFHLMKLIQLIGEEL